MYGKWIYIFFSHHIFWLILAILADPPVVLVVTCVPFPSSLLEPKSDHRPDRVTLMYTFLLLHQNTTNDEEVPPIIQKIQPIMYQY